MAKTHITTLQRGIASVLITSQLLISCGFNETILLHNKEASPSPLKEIPIGKDNTSALTAIDSAFKLSTTTVGGTKLIFDYTKEAGLQMEYQNSNMPSAVPVQEYPVIDDVNGRKIPFTKLEKEDAILLAQEGKWEVSKSGALKYVGMRGRGGMQSVDSIEDKIQKLEFELQKTEEVVDDIINRIKQTNDKIAILNSWWEFPSEEDKKERLSDQEELLNTQNELLESKQEKLTKLKEEIEKEKQQRDDVQKQKQKQKQKQEQKIKCLQLLGNNYLGEEAWLKLGLQSDQLSLPVITDDLFIRLEVMQRLSERPLLFLDLGKSIAEMERLCTAKGITVLSTNNGGDPTKLRAETCYQAVGAGSRWLLLPGSDKGVLPGSRSKSYQDQIKYMESNYPGYAVGGARELVTLAMLKQIQDGTLLFPEAPYTFGRCKEEYQTGNWKGYRVFLGRNSSRDSGCLAAAHSDDDRVHRNSGVFCVVSS